MLWARRITISCGVLISIICELKLNRFPIVILSQPLLLHEQKVTSCISSDGTLFSSKPDKLVQVQPLYYLFHWFLFLNGLGMLGLAYIAIGYTKNDLTSLTQW